MIERAQTYTPEESAAFHYWPDLYANDAQFLLDRLADSNGG